VKERGNDIDKERGEEVRGRNVSENRRYLGRGK